MSPSVGNDGAHVHHVLPVAQGNLSVLSGCQRLALLLHVRGFTCQGCFLRLHGCAFHNPGVRGHRVSGLQDQQITPDHFIRVDGFQVPAADHLCCGSRHLLQCLNRGFRFTLLVNTQAGVDHNHRQDDNGIGQALTGIQCRDGAYHRRDDQYDSHGILQFPEELPEQAFLFAFLQLVVSVPGKPCSGFFFAQAFHGGTRFSQYGFLVLKIWFQFLFLPVLFRRFP